MKMKICITLFLVASFSAAIAQTPSVVVSNSAGWHKIGERHAGFKSDLDEIVVMGNDHFRQIKIKVKDATINLSSFTVYFSNDTKQEIPMTKIIHAGEETIPVDIDNAYGIKKIVLNYKTVAPTSTDVTRETKVQTATEKEKEREHEKETERERAEVEIWALK